VDAADGATAGELSFDNDRTDSVDAISFGVSANAGVP
jgi:hypothetical protein